MHELGFEFTHFAEFAWAQLEPEEGRYDFAWLDRAVALAAKYDLKVIMCTSTATPPVWMSRKYPEILLKNEDGTIVHRRVPVAREMFSADKKIATAKSLDIGFVMTSSNEDVLKVADEVYLDVMGKGSSVITLKTADGRWSYSWKVTVSDKATSFAEYSTGFKTGIGMDQSTEKNGFVTKL